MKKSLQKSPTTRPRYACHLIIKRVACCTLFIFAVLGGVVLLAWCFGVELLSCASAKPLSITYCAVYTLPNDPTYESAYNLGEHLKLRGAGGNIITDGTNYIVVLAVYKDTQEANSVIDNLSKQNITCKYQTIALTEDISKLSKDEQQTLNELFELNISCIDKLINIIYNLEQTSITQMDAYVEVFSLFTQHQNTLNNLPKPQNEQLALYVQKTINVQSLLYLLTQENHHSATNANYLSVVRNFAYRMLDALK